MKAQNPDQSLCPLCGESNACAIVEGDGLRATESFQCWCMSYPKVDLERKQLNVACLCAKCLKQQLQSAGNGEMAS